MQFENASWSILIAFDWIITNCKEMQSLNAFLPILSTDVGIVTPINDLHWLNE